MPACCALAKSGIRLRACSAVLIAWSVASMRSNTRRTSSESAPAAGLRARKSLMLRYTFSSQARNRPNSGCSSMLGALPSVRYSSKDSANFS